MLINHTSGLAEYLPYAYPSLKAFPALADTGPQSPDDHRLTRFDPTELIELGVTAPAAGPPGGTPGLYVPVDRLTWRAGMLMHGLAALPVRTRA
ncbi:hypothetical protein [Spongiactinospora gelatinilytica]|uniref:hypothetical protein n=1 Tax=Spongiactinospora gelatinilytica TaxID=2666298 RepID=UPI0027B8C3D0|nr:hypothetical protein [Spongiactinospora gelatinilytica]